MRKLAPWCLAALATATATATATPSLAQSLWSQSFDNTTIIQGSASCLNNPDGITDNSFWRLYDPAQFGQAGTFTIESVRFGIEDATTTSGAQLVEVAIRDGAGFPVGASAAPILGSASMMVADTDVSQQTFETITFNPPIAMAAGQRFSVELRVFNGQPQGDFFFIGSNTAGETPLDSSFISAADCGIIDPVPTASVGFPVHFVLDVGTTSGSLSADFVANPTAGVAPLAVAFTDQSSGTITSWSWNFGDGFTSSAQNPTHLYATCGTYNVSLTVSGPAGSDTRVRAGYVQVSPGAAFAAAPTTGTAPLAVTFTDQSSGMPTGWLWSFGDGATSNAQNPTHTYASCGRYTVTLTAMCGALSTTATQTDLIEVSPSAAFTGNPTSGTSPLSVQFTDQSVGDPTAWLWSFGDGTNSNAQSPAHVYTSCGRFTVSLTATCAGLTSTETKVHYINTAPVAEFAATPLQGPAPLEVQFSDQSAGSPTSWLWVFGDGNSSVLQNPLHEYTAPGTYTVSLTAACPGGSDIETKNTYITVDPPPDLFVHFEKQTTATIPSARYVVPVLEADGDGYGLGEPSAVSACSGTLRSNAHTMRVILTDLEDETPLRTSAPGTFQTISEQYEVTCKVELGQSSADYDCDFEVYTWPPGSVAGDPAQRIDATNASSFVLIIGADAPQTALERAIQVRALADLNREVEPIESAVVTIQSVRLTSGASSPGIAVGANKRALVLIEDSFNQLAPQPGPECSSALDIVGVGNFGIDTSGATSSSVPGSSCLPVRDIWFRWTAPTAGEYFFDTYDTETFSTLIEIYEGTCGALTSRVCHNGSLELIPTEGSGVSLTVSVAGSTYFLRIGAVDGDERTGMLSVKLLGNGPFVQFGHTTPATRTRLGQVSTKPVWPEPDAMSYFGIRYFAVNRNVNGNVAGIPLESKSAFELRIGVDAHPAANFTLTPGAWDPSSGMTRLLVPIAQESAGVALFGDFVLPGGGAGAFYEINLTLESTAPLGGAATSPSIGWNSRAKWLMINN
ncbi:MAG: PKD domain-containing protein [bacterium]|nr:PKD domain-containing protein [bacterium]